VNAVMDEATCRAQLQKLLADENALLAVLEGQLSREHELLTSNDIDGLDAAGSARQDTVSRLLRLDDDRRALCRALGRHDSVTGVADLLKWCDPTSSLLTAYQHCTDLATRCRQQNDRNGALVTARLNHVSNMLGMLNVTGNDAKVYGTRSSASANHIRTGRLLATSA
jgi:flagellar biosynthesis protein FlgN